MHRLLILIALTLCFLCGLTGQTFANKYCGNLSVETNQICECVVRNYGTTADTNITIFLYIAGLFETCGSLTVGPGEFSTCGHQFQGEGYCGCKVIGEGSYTRASLVVEAGSTNFTPLASLPCN